MSLVRDLALAIPAIRRLHHDRNMSLVKTELLERQLQDCRDNLRATQSYLAGVQGGAAAAPPDATGLLSDRGSPFFTYNTVFDAEAIIRRYAVVSPKARAGYLTNFLDVAIDPKFFPQLLDGRAGEVEGLPIPGNWHADLAEFAAALRAVSLARDHFTMIELGCGWGCWMNNCGAAARRAGLQVHLIGVEGDRGHICFAQQAAATNGFDASQITLHHGIAAAGSGVALFPRQERAGVSWGLQPIFGASDAQREQAVRSGDYDALPMIPLADIAAPHKRIDFLHIDIQGGEADLVEACLGVLQDKVAYMFIGTHSREIEGRLFDVMLRAGWRLEIERPGLLKLDGAKPYMWIDGVQGWRNMALLPA